MKPEFTQFLSSMEELSLSFLGIHVLGNLSDVVYGVFWTALFIPRFLMPGQSQLASLSLTSDMPIGQDPPVQFDTLRFPALRSLSLNGVVFDNEERLDRFVMNHHATLATLELNSCPIYFPDTVTLDVPRRWSNLLQRFEAGLQQLVQFRVLLRSGWGLDNLEVFEPAETRLTYVSSLSGFGYPRGGWGDPADDAVRAEDAASLERPLDVLHRRRLSL
ncbi:hypothetical protein SCP_0803330 [Sparassis crispa]|uniref:F-box domain-containing protein n=1 Tax=Sparassis crispa TaxID=139825 RepID=A0A401GUA7_9APHY|nr:hypothetical protein SCP_0803330 [Sparassis crispa]GBE85811.1 hypothetical protein SCP_0803330 [Sparassis crispa]